MSDLSLGNSNFDHRQTELIAEMDDDGGDYNGDIILLVRPTYGLEVEVEHSSPKHSLTAIQGTGWTEGSRSGVGVEGIGGVGGYGPSGIGVRGIGVNGGEGVLGDGDGNGDRGDYPGGGVGVRGISKTNDGVQGQSDKENKSGVYGFNSMQSGSAFGVSGECNSSDGAGVLGITSSGEGVRGASTSGIGVRGFSKYNDGVSGKSESGGNGVSGLSLVVGKSGVHGENTAKPGTKVAPGMSSNAFGVSGKADLGIGVFGSSANGVGVSGTGGRYGGIFDGKRAPVRLVPSTSEGPPTNGPHERGELYVDSTGNLFFCGEDGTPGKWFRISMVPA